MEEDRTSINPDDVEIGEFLSGGAFGNVYLATRKQWGYVIIKKYLRIILDKDMLQGSTATIKSLSFPHLVAIFGIISDLDNPLSIVMEYMEFGNLKDFNVKTMMKCDCWARKVKMVEDISLGMNYLHSMDQRIEVTSCLKLENVLVGAGFVAKIAISEVFLQAVKLPPGETYSIDVTHSAAYLPPEVWSNRNQKLDEPWNVYSFAMTIYGLLSGDEPWNARTGSSDISTLVQSGSRPDVSQLPVKAPSEIIALIKKCWDGSPSKRPSFKDIHEKVNDIYQMKYKTLIRRADKAIMVVLADEEATQIGTSASPSGLPNIQHRQSHLDVARRERKVSTRIGFTGPPPGAQPKPSLVHNTKEWQLAKQFGQEGDQDGDFRLAESIAVFKNGTVVVVDTRTTGGKRIYLFNEDGVYQSTLRSQHGMNDPKTNLLLPEDVAVTCQGHLIIADQSQHVKIYHANGTYIQSFSTLSESEDAPDEKVSATRVVVTPQDDVIVGDRHRRLVTTHSPSDNWIPKKIPVPIRPCYLATNNQRHVIVSDDWERTVVALNFYGIILYMIEDFTVDGEMGEPYGMACDENGDVYIAVMKVSKNNQVRQGSGHIHQYDNNGKYLRCIATYLRRPYGITMANGSLYVANKKSVSVYKS
ncbi:uncharacterized protein [Amphiura filiformis]|uniref:uncharacterized protein n=1 Tax=Amphiura filiformis TaxID=82378 RepID=UPI003B228CDD